MVVIDGIRRILDINGFKQRFNFYLIYLESEPKVRWRRLVARNQNIGDAKVSWRKFLRQDSAETEAGIADFKAKADFVIINNGSKREFLSALDQILIKIVKNN